MLRLGPALLLFVCAAWPTAAAAWPDDTSPGTFAVTVEGSQQTVVTRTRRSTDELGCFVTRSDVDRQSHVFSTSRPGRLVVPASGRPGPARVAVSVEAAGSRLRKTDTAGPAPGCEASPQTAETACGPVTLAGNAVVRLPAPGAVNLSGSFRRGRDNARCAAATAPGSPFLAASKGTFQARFLTDPMIERVVLRGRARRTDNLASGARRVTTVRWTLVLTRTH